MGAPRAWLLKFFQNWNSDEESRAAPNHHPLVPSQDSVGRSAREGSEVRRRTSSSPRRTRRATPEGRGKVQSSSQAQGKRQKSGATCPTTWR